MWQRFTERARRVVFFAQEEAGNREQNDVDTEDLLLGLLRESDSVAARILLATGLSFSSLREAVAAKTPMGQGRSGRDMQLTPRAKRSIDLAYDEARQLDNNYIGTEHLLLGLIREGEGVAGQVLTAAGVELGQIREAVRELQKQHPEAAAASSAGVVTPIAGSTERTPSRGDIGTLKRPESSLPVPLVLEAADIAIFDEIMETRDDYAYREILLAGKVVRIASGTPAKFLGNQGMHNASVRILEGEHAGKRGYVRRNCLQETRPDDRPFPPEV